MGLEMGSDKTSKMGIEGERKGMASKWFSSPCMGSLDVPSLNSFRCPICGKGVFLSDSALR
jgi:hypothetical protein